MNNEEKINHMAKNDMDIRLSVTPLQAVKVKQGAQITMGADEKAIGDLAAGTHYFCLYIINKEQFDALDSTQSKPQS